MANRGEKWTCPPFLTPSFDTWTPPAYSKRSKQDNYVKAEQWQSLRRKWKTHEREDCLTGFTGPACFMLDRVEYADHQKKRLLSWLLPRLEGHEIVRAELPFDGISGKADIAILGPKRLAAIEIKGPRDNVGRLDRQINSYRAMFLESWVATAPKHLVSIRRKVPKSVGLIVLNTDGEHPAVVRKAVVKRNLTRDAASRWLRTRELSGFSLMSDVSRRHAKDIETLRKQVCRSASTSELTTYVLTTLANRYSDAYRVFRHELGDAITLDDIHLLSLQRLPSFRSI
jgi:hypothetical protein